MKNNSRRDLKEVENFLPSYWQKQAECIADELESIKKKRKVITNKKNSIRSLYWQIGTDSLGFPLIIFSQVNEKNYTIDNDLTDIIKKEENRGMKHSDTCPEISSTNGIKMRAKKVNSRRKLTTRSWQETDSENSMVKNGAVSTPNTPTSESPSSSKLKSDSRIQKSSTADHLSIYSSTTIDSDQYACRSLGDIDEDKVLEELSKSNAFIEKSGKSPSIQKQNSKFLMHLLRLDRFASHVGKIGDAERKRKQASNAVGQSNPLRRQPISQPIDYEKFISEKSAQLENDSQRDLLLFPRDDIAETEVFPEERTAIPSVNEGHLDDAKWLLTKEALQLYSAPYKVVSFNYAEYAGDFKKLDCPSLSTPRFEADLLAEEKAAQFTNQKPSEVIREGFVTVVPVDSSFVDNFRSDKRRYCIVRRDETGSVFVELQKQPNVPTNQQPVEIKNLSSIVNKKGRPILQIFGSQEPGPNEKPILALSPENESELTFWVLDINRVLTATSDKDDDQSIGSSNDALGTSTRSFPDTDSIGSEDSNGSLRDASGAHIWRGKNAVGRALQPPVIVRRNLFCLYPDLDPLPSSKSPQSCLLQKIPTSTVTRNLLDTTKDSMSEVSQVCMNEEKCLEKKVLKIQVEFRGLKCHVAFAQNNPEHFEPLFLRIYLLDVANATRLTEEFKMSLVPKNLEQVFKDGINVKMTPVGSPKHFTGPPKTVNEIDYSILMHPGANKLICTLNNSEDVFVIVRIERLLSDCSPDIYSKNNIDQKQATKIQKTILTACNKLAKYRCPFAWTACPIFPSLAKPGFPAQNGGWQLFKSEGKMTDFDLQKYLVDCVKAEKSGKITAIPNAYINIAVNSLHSISSIPYRISSSLLPLKPWHDMSAEKIPVFELQSFCDIATEPYNELINLLYVYPVSLSYGSQKTFGRARNISVTVRFVGSIKKEGSNAKMIIDRSNPLGPYLSSGNTAVQYHEANPQFNDEVKVQLPVVLDSTDHLLFSFTHISVSNALSPKSEKDSVETAVGFAWLPLTRNENFLIMGDDVQEFDLPVAATLPTGYIHYNHLIPSRTQQKQPDIKWMDNGKPLFRVRLKLVSSAFTTEPALQSFFQSCQKLQDLKSGKLNGSVPTGKESTPTGNNRSCSPEPESEVKEEEYFDKVASKACKLFEVDITRLIPHFHIVLKRLLYLLPLTKSSDIGAKILSVTIGIVDNAHTSRYDYILRNFVRYHFSSTTSDDDETTHGAICRHLVTLLESIKGESRGLSRIFRQLWFLFDITIKSMAQWLIHTKKFKSSRRERFSADFLMKVDNVVSTTVDLIWKNSELPEANAANIALAYFLRCCLSLTDRYEIFKSICNVVEIYDRHAAADPSSSRQNHILRTLKLEFLQILIGHEHWIPLSLPILTDRHNNILRGGPTGVYNEVQNNSGFISRFFSLFSSHSNGSPSIDHDTGERFDNYSDHFWLSSNYCKVHFPIGLLIQELMASLREPRDYRPLVISLMRNILAKHSADTRYTDKIAQGRIALLYMPLLQFAIENIKELDATAKAAMETPEVGATMALGTTWNALSNYDINSKAKQTLTNNSNQRRMTIQQTSDGQKITLMPLVEKLTKVEARDILISILYILARIPKKTLSNIWMIQEQNNNPNGLVDFLHLLELSLQMFSYPGRSYLLKQLTKRKQLLAKANATVNFQFGNEKTKTQPGDISNPRGTIDSQASTVTMSTEPPSSATLTMDLNNDDLENSTPMAFFKECNLTQEVGITILEIAQAVSSEVAVRCSNLSNKSTDTAFNRLLLLYIRLLDESWPEAVRLNSLAALSIFVSHFASRFFYSGPMEPLSLIIEAMLLQLNSRYQKIQQASAALLQAILRKGYEVVLEQRSKEAVMESITPSRSRSINMSKSLIKSQTSKSRGIEMLGRPGTQTSVALARLLGQRIPLAQSPHFERGLGILESLIVTQAAEKKLSPFENAVMELIEQLKGAIVATGALKDAEDNPIRLAELHIQLADSYRGSARLRCTWFDTLADRYISDGWFSEAAVCQAHSVTIIAKELSLRGLIKVDWSLLDVINDRIAIEENVNSSSMDMTQEAGFTLDSLTEKVETTVQTLIQAERYEAVGPICRLAIPVYEKVNDYKALMSIYMELQQASSRAAEIKASGKRHLGSYFRVVLHSPYFREEDKTEWIYRERGLTSLAEACERMVLSVQRSLGHDKVQALPENKIDPKGLKENVAYIQMTHVEPCLKLPENIKGDQNSMLEDIEDDEQIQAGDPMNYYLHTNVRNFYYEETFTDESVPKDAPEMARLSLRRIYLTVKEPFPNTSRRQKVITRNEMILNPLELACEKLTQKATQIRRFLATVGIPPRCAVIGVDPAAVAKLDIKGLQCFLQGAVSPAVNVGVLAYAEAFTLPHQRERYGQAGIDRLVISFKILMTELQDALEVNGKAIASDQQEYHEMMKKSFTGMLERLKDFFGNQDFILKYSNVLEDSYDTAHVLNSIGGVPVCERL